MIFAIMAFAIFAVVGMAMDTSRAQSAKSTMQMSLDSAALSAAIDPYRSEEVRISEAQGVFAKNWKASGLSNAPVPVITLQGDLVTASGTTDIPTTLMAIAGIESMTINVSAQARSASDIGDPCILTLNQTDNNALELSGSSNIDAPGCGIAVNSSDSNALTISGGATINADATCVHGGIAGTASDITPAATIGCRRIADPLAAFVPPTHGICDYHDFDGISGVPLSPGVYCGGIEFTGAADAIFEPGIYVIKNGKLTSSGGGTLTGTGVTFHFVGNDAGFDLSGGADVDLHAPVSGDFKGILIYMDTDANPGSESKLSGGGSMIYEGIIYMPTQKLNVSGGGSTSTVADFTWFIVDKFVYSGGSTLTIKSDRDAATVPIPDGVSFNQSVRLVL